MKKPPNVIVILSDDQGYGDLSLYGNPLIHTPHFERLAQRGVTMTQHYSGAPLCAPARAALLTGRYHQRSGAISVESNRGVDRICLSDLTMADYFKSAGYATGMLGKWHNGLFDRRHHPNARGFDEFLGFLNGGMGYYDWVLDGNGSPRHSNGEYLTDVFSEEAVNFITRHRAEPFFLYLAYNAPHDPLEAPPHLIEKYRQSGQLNETVATIYAMIEQMDAGIGRVLDTLEAQGLADDTIVLFTSDNGPWLGDFGEGRDYNRFNGPFSGMKNFCLEGGIRVPAILSWPAGLPAGLNSSEMIHFTDWLPSLFSVAGSGAPAGAKPLDGVNVLDVLRGDQSLSPRKLFWQHNRNQPLCHCNSVMRDGEWKLVWPYPEGAIAKSPDDNFWYREMFTREHFEMPVKYTLLPQKIQLASHPLLYNIADDPGEAMNLAERFPARRAAMEAELHNWFDAVERDREEVVRLSR